MYKIYTEYLSESSWTIDIWTGLGQNEFAGYTAHWIDEEWVFRRATLDLDYFPQRHTGENIAAKCTELTAKFGGQKPFQVVSDSGSNVVLGKSLFLGKEGIACKAHGLDNLMKKCIEESDIAPLLKRQTKAVKFIRKSNNANRILREHQVTLHDEDPNPFDAYHRSLGWDPYPHNPLRLSIAGKTRWWSSKKQNKRWLRLKPALVPTLEALMESDDIKPQKKLNFEYSTSDWKVFEQIDDIFDPFKKAIKELEGEKYPTLSLVTMHIFSLHTFILNRHAALQSNSEWSSRIRNLLKLLKEGLEKMIEELPEEAYIASLLDPRFLDTFIPPHARQRWWNRLQELMDELPENDQAAEVAAPDLPAPVPANAPAPFLPRAGTRTHPNAPVKKLSYDEIMNKKFAEKGIDQAAATPYHQLPPLPRRVSPLQWWKVKERTYPKHARLARRYLAIPATSAPCERLFSTGGRVIEKRRASLKPETAKAIVFLHENLDMFEEIAEDNEEYYND